MGKAYPVCLADSETLDKLALTAAGANDSLVHEDFMIGSGEMDINGVLANGTIEPIFTKGRWAF